MTSVESVRAELAVLHAKGLAGDIPRRRVDGLLAEKTVALYRAAVLSRLPDDERILAEHHAALGHLHLAESVLREPDQEAVSLFLTDRRLIRVRALLSSARPASLSDEDGTVIDEVRLDEIEGLAVRREVRWGEVAAGVAIAAFALFFKSWLLITGTFLLALGGLGVLHALLVPTRWIEILAPQRLAPEPWRILAARKKSARTLRRSLADLLRRRSSTAPR
jgi:hypothetical protein